MFWLGRSEFDFHFVEGLMVKRMLTFGRMRLVGRDKEPLDVSREDHRAVFEASMGKWAREMAENDDGSKFGYVDVEGVELQPYGTPYAAAA